MREARIAKDELVELEEKMANQLLNFIDSGSINEESIGALSYWYLEALRRLTMQMENGKELFVAIKTYLESVNIKRLKKQEKIVIGVMTDCAFTGCGDELYELLEASDRFELYIFVIADFEGAGRGRENLYDESIEYFEKKNRKVKGTLNLETGKQYTWEELGIKPEVCIWLTPWISLFKDQFYLPQFSLDTLHTYIPYGFMAAENEKGEFVDDQYNQMVHNLSWKIFEESKSALEMAEKYSYVGKSNAVFTGLPTMDKFYQRKHARKAVWDKLLDKAGNPNAKKIIYAPHHTVEITRPICFSTFEYNCRMMLKLAKKYQEETVWIFKPHPLLKENAVGAGIFASEEEWHIYEEEWDSLKNGTCDYEVDYEELFMESNAMILDSVSFLAEYLYSHHPLLFLERKSQYFNDFGRELKQHHYCAEGEDEKTIEKFIQDIVINGVDSGKAKREAFFLEKLDYMKVNHKTASESIRDVLMEL